jgi:branched-chain amino acid transport system ATP-binding protein
MLEVSGISVFYGEAEALRDVSLTVGPQEIVAVLGSNGAGKTTLVGAIAGVLPCRAGRITLDDRVLTDLPRHKVSAAGVAIVPEGRRLFTRMTVRENLQIGAYAPEARRQMQETLEEVHDLFPILADRADQKAGTLSGGQQQMLAIGRALMTRPRYLLLDEPSLGLAPIIVDTLFDLIEKVHRSGLGVLLVEQNVVRALEVSSRGYVLAEGRVVLEGTRDELLGSERVRQAYLAI